MRYKVGDTVIIKNDIIVPKISAGKLKYAGRGAIITAAEFLHTTQEFIYKIDIDYGYYWWSKRCFDNKTQEELLLEGLC